MNLTVVLVSRRVAACAYMPFLTSKTQKAAKQREAKARETRVSQASQAASQEASPPPPPKDGGDLKCILCMHIKPQGRFLLVEHDDEAANCVTKDGRHVCIQCVNEGHRKAPIYREP